MDETRITSVIVLRYSEIALLSMPLTYRIVIAQLIAVLIVALGLSLIAADEVRSALIGGSVCVLPAAGFAWQAEHTRRGGSLLAQGAAKSVAIMALMVAAFVVARPAALGFFSALVAAQAMYLLVPVLTRSNLPEGKR